MKQSLRTVLIVLVILSSGVSARGQTPPLRGVVWHQPGDLQQAISDLYEMRRAGVQAVRTGIVGNEQLLTVADDLGIQVFQDLPVENLSAAGLQDTLAFAARTLDQVLARAEQHPSARHFGLARMSDTSNPAACAYFEQLAGRIRQSGLPGARAYYVTPFIEADACAGAVDLVLLNALDAESPRTLLERYVEQDSTRQGRVGIGAVGTWVDDEAEPGLSVPHSPQSQARYLENSLNLLLSRRAPVQPYAVFVYRWSDPVSADAAEAGSEHPVPVTYGLGDGRNERLALDVVRGIYTGDQMVFAFDHGGEPSDSWPWIMLLGWGSVAVLGVFYAASPRLRFMVPRYFGARGFYRDAVREGRDVLLGSSVALLTVAALTTGILWSAAIDACSTEEAFLMLLRWTGDPIRDLLASAQSRPWVAVLLFSAVFAASALLWSAVLVLVSQRRYALAPSQTLMLIIWPRWPLLLVLPAAMVVPTLGDETARTVSLILLAVWACIMLYAILRTAYDFNEVTRVPPYLTLAAWLVNPFIVLLLILVLVALFNLPEAIFLYHLLTRA